MSAGLRVRELTARGRGAIRVLELTGEGAAARLAALAPRQRLVPGEFARLALRDSLGELLDECLVLTATHEHVELHLHGAPALVARVLRELGAEAGEPAPQGIEERASALLAGAHSEAAARMLLDQTEGALRAELEALLALEDPRAQRGAARRLARLGRCARWLLVPPRVMLAGPVNAGKSTLFNLLVGRERVVVDAAAGTTRDAVRELVQLGSHAVELVDTAGERELTLGAAESESHDEAVGQALACELRRSADVVLWLVPPDSAPPAAAERQVVVHSRADLPSTRAGARSGPAISVLCSPACARETVEALVNEALELPREPWVPGRGVPFEQEWTEQLERGEPSELVRAVRSWLEPS